MDIMLQRHCARYIYVVPDGLRELMSDISREVLRSEPEDIYTFIADYLDALLITRENARISAKFVQYMTEASETIVDLLNRTGMTREEADSAASVIQEAFRAWSERKGILKEDEEVVVARIIEEAGISEAQVQSAAVVIQHAFRTFKLRQQRESQLLTGIVDWRVAARSAIRLYRKTGVSPEEAKRAASLIKAAYKGYYTRRAIRQLNEQPIGEEERGEEAEAGEEGGSWEGYPYGEPRKSKGVRIDYNTVVPHVDFGGEELISRDIVSVTEEEPPQDANVYVRIFGEQPESIELMVKEILDAIILGAVGSEEEPQPLVEDRDSDVDSFVPPPIEEPVEPLLNKSQLIPVLSQDEIDVELKEARQEMVALQQKSEERQAGLVDGEEREIGMTASVPSKTSQRSKSSLEKRAAKEEPLEEVKEEEVAATEEPPPSEKPPEVTEVPPEAPEPVEVPPEAPEPVEVPPEAPEPVDVPPEASEPVEVPPEAPEPVDVPPEAPEPVEVPPEEVPPVAPLEEAPQEEVKDDVPTEE